MFCDEQSTIALPPLTSAIEQTGPSEPCIWYAYV